MIRDEFVFSPNGRKLYTLKDILDYEDEILSETFRNNRWWNDVRRGYYMVFIQKTKRFEAEPEPVLIGKMQSDDLIKKFG